MSVDHSGTSVKWDQLQQLVDQGTPVSQWGLFDETEEFSTEAGYGYYSDHSSSSFNLLYDALRGELPTDQREFCDRFYAAFHWWASTTKKLSPVPNNLRTQITDLKPNNDLGIINGILSPDSVTELAKYGSVIDFDEITRLLNSMYSNPDDWKDDGSILSGTKSPLIAKNWKHQSALVKFDDSNRFFNVADALDHARTWIEPMIKTSNATEGFLLTVSY